MTSDSFRTTDPFLRRVFAGEEFLVFDGAMGTMLQEAGLKAGELPELLNFSHPETVTAIHRAYMEAGADVIPWAPWISTRRTTSLPSRPVPPRLPAPTSSSSRP